MKASPRTPRDNAYHHGDLRRALLDAALAIVEEGGDATLRAVARRAGVSHTAPYHHFPDRRALLAAVAEEGLYALRSALIEAAADAPEGAEFFETGVAYVRFAVGSPARFRLMFSSELADRAGLPDLQTASDEAYGVLLDGVRRMFGESATPEAVSLRALGAWASVHGLSMLIVDAQVPGVSRDVGDADRIARLVLAAPRITGSPPPAG